MERDRARREAAVLDQPLRRGVARLEDQVPDRELAEQAGISLGRAPAAGVERALAVRDEQLGQAAEPPDPAADRPQQIGCLLREDEPGRDRPRTP
jgi:hypothetical protein